MKLHNDVADVKIFEHIAKPNKFLNLLFVHSVDV